jgi:hypothetical protein
MLPAEIRAATGMLLPGSSGGRVESRSSTIDFALATAG